MAAIGQARLTFQPFRHLRRGHRMGDRIALGYVGTQDHHRLEHSGIFDPFHDHRFAQRVTKVDSLLDKTQGIRSIVAGKVRDLLVNLDQIEWHFAQTVLAAVPGTEIILGQLDSERLESGQLPQHVYAGRKCIRLQSFQGVGRLGHSRTL
jgi:hypothetical protein